MFRLVNNCFRSAGIFNERVAIYLGHGREFRQSPASHLDMVAPGKRIFRGYTAGMGGYKLASLQGKNVAAQKS